MYYKIMVVLWLAAISIEVRQAVTLAATTQWRL